MPKVDSICVLTTDYPSKNRPVYVFVEQLVCTLVDNGVEVTVIAPQSLTKCLLRRIPILPNFQKFHTSVGREYGVYRPSVISFGKGRKILYRIFGRYNRHSVECCLDKLQPQILYAHFWTNAVSLKKYVSEHQIPLFVACGEGNDAMERLEKSMTTIDKRNLNRVVTGVICVSTVNKNKCVSYGFSRQYQTIVLPNAVDTRLFHPMKRNNNLRKSLGVNEKDFLIIFVGAFVPRKGCGILAKAIDSLNDPHVKVIFAGNAMAGDEDDPVCKGIVYKGIIEHQELPNYYACSDVFVLPTLNEGCSNAIVEALAMAVPVISSHGSFNDDILDDTNSIRVNPLSVDEVAAAIMKMKNDLDFYSRIRGKLLNKANSYSISARANRILTFMDCMLTNCNSDLRV